MKYRIEKDSLGEVQVSIDKLWGAQTERSLNNFKIGNEIMPKEIIEAYLIIKEAAAKANMRLNNLDKKKCSIIVKVAQKIRKNLDAYYEHFPLVVWQTGSGTQTNMNVNEVIANLCNQENDSLKFHPNDDINRSQSSNDTFPTAIHLASYKAINEKLYPALSKLRNALENLVYKYQDLIKIGRTHLQDATPLTLGQEISAWVEMLDKSKQMIKDASKYLLSLAIGGTAVGTGLNSHKLFGEYVTEEINRMTGFNFESAKNKFHALTSYDSIVFVHGALKALAANLMKIANDIRWLSSGPRAGLGELIIPSNEAGSSIMPGKVNPTQAEALMMIVTQVFGNDLTLSFSASQGNFQLNVYKPVIIHNFVQSVRLLSDGMNSFCDNCVIGIKANEEVISKYVNDSLMLVTALTPHIGYDKAAEIANNAYINKTTLKEEAIKLGYLTKEEFEKYMDVNKMIKPFE